MKKNKLGTVAILSFAAICITFIICGKPDYALGSIVIVVLGYAIGSFFRIFF